MLVSLGDITMNKSVKKICQWGKSNGLIFTGKEGQNKRELMEVQARQSLKAVSKLLSGYADKDIDMIKVSIGDFFLSLIIGACSIGEHDFMIIGFDTVDQITEDNSNTNRFQLSTITSTALGLIISCKKDVICRLDYGISILKLNDVLKMINRDFKVKLTFKDCLESSLSKEMLC